MTNALEITGLSKSFGKVNIVDDINLQVKKGLVYGLVGLNGVGKTTIIKCCIGLHLFEKGEIKFFDIPHTDKKSRQNISFLPDNFRPSRFVTGYEFIKFALDIKNQPFDKVQIDDLAEKLDLPLKYLSYKTAACSRGTLQKIGLLVCFASSSPFIILDEPMNGLDVRARFMLKNLIKEEKVKGRTILFSSHILPDIEEICDEIAIFHDRSFKFIGTPSDLLVKCRKSSLEECFIDLITPKYEQN